MLAYQIRIALKSLKRNPVLSTLLVAGIALGIAISTSFVTTYYMLSGDPIPEKSDQPSCECCVWEWKSIDISSSSVSSRPTIGRGRSSTAT